MIKSLKLTNVRSFVKTEFEFEPGVNLIIGPNGSGKTTILESIGLLAFGKYLSTAQDSFAIRKGETVARIEVKVKDEEARFVEIGFSAKEKIIKVNGSAEPVSRLIGLAPQVLFNPETVELVFDSPSLRRRELDMVLTQADHKFVLDILGFRKILKQRNSLLRSISAKRAGAGELDFWNKRFEEFSLKIYQARHELLDFYNESIAEVFSSLSLKQGKLKLKYLASADYDRFSESITAHQEMDVENGLTSIGPHRDDFTFLLDNHSMREGASRGEQRLAAVAFKVMASEYLIDKGIEPIIVLDDVFSELDVSRRVAVAESLCLFKVEQVFISATDDSAIPESLINNSHIIRL